jgi:hypothetical protein
MHRFLLFALALMFFAATPACSSETKPSSTVEVTAGDSGDLYRKLLHPDYAGRTLRLKGAYVLSATTGTAAVDRLLSEDGFAETDLNARVFEATRLGYLDLGDRHLEGENRMVYVDQIADHVDVDPTNGETVIDGTQLESNTVSLSHYLVTELEFFENRSLVRAKEGNHIKGITLRWKHLGGKFQQAISLEGNGSHIEGCKFDVPGIQAGILAYARGKDLEGGRVSAELVGNIGDDRISFAFVIASTLFTRNAQTDISLVGNNLARQVVIQNPASEGGTVRVTSQNNRYLSLPDVPGVLVRGGFSPAQFTHSRQNRSEFASLDDRFDGSGAGLMARGGHGFEDKEASSNVVKVDLVRASFHGTTIDVAGVAGTGNDNLVELLVRQSVADPSVAVRAEHGVGVNNRVQITGSRAEWEATNTGLLPPAAEFFLDK